MDPCTNVLELHATAQGKIALAFGGSTLLSQLKRKELKALTPSTLTDLKQLEAECQTVRTCGFACSPNEDTIGINAIASPIFDGNSNAIGALAIVGSIQNIGFPVASQQVDAVLRATQRVSWSLGYKGTIP